MLNMGGFSKHGFVTLAGDCDSFNSDSGQNNIVLCRLGYVRAGWA